MLESECGWFYSWMYFIFFNHASKQIKCVKQRKWGDVKRSSQINKIWTRLTQPGGGVNDAAERNRYSNFDLKTGIIKSKRFHFHFYRGLYYRGSAALRQGSGAPEPAWIGGAPYIQYLWQPIYTVSMATKLHWWDKRVTVRKTFWQGGNWSENVTGHCRNVVEYKV